MLNGWPCCPFSYNQTAHCLWFVPSPRLNKTNQESCRVYLFPVQYPGNMWSNIKYCIYILPPTAVVWKNNLNSVRMEGYIVTSHTSPVVATHWLATCGYISTTCAWPLRLTWLECFSERSPLRKPGLQCNLPFSIVPRLSLHPTYFHIYSL